MRPTVRTMVNRFAITLVCLILVGCLAVALYRTPKPGSALNSPEFLAQKQEIDTMAEEMTEDMIHRGLITQEEVDAINQKSQQRIDDARERQAKMDRLFRTGIYSGMGFFGFFAVLAPISVTWERVRFTTNVRGELLVRRRDSIGWSSKQYIPEESINQLFVIAREHREGNSKSGYRTVGWMWEVYAQGDNNEGLVVSVDLSPGRPLENRQLPENVQQVAKTISTFTGCSLRPSYTVTNIDSIDNGLFRSRTRQSGTNQNVASSTQTYANLDDLPPQFREKFQEAQARGETGPIHMEQSHTIGHPTGQPITYRAPNGAVHTYNSIDDMPPELQRIFRDLKK